MSCWRCRGEGGDPSHVWQCHNCGRDRQLTPGTSPCWQCGAEPKKYVTGGIALCRACGVWRAVEGAGRGGGVPRGRLHLVEK